MKDYHFINLLNVVQIFVVNGMCTKVAYHHVSVLDILTQKSLMYLRHIKNYLESLQQRIIPLDVKLKENPEILPFSFDFEERLSLTLKETEKKLVEELLIESEKIIASIETQIQPEMKDKNAGDFILKWKFLFWNTIYDERKNRMKDYHLINLLNVMLTFVVNDMCPKDGYHHVSRLDISTQKSLRYLRHRENYLEHLRQGIIPSGLKLKKKPEILPVS